MVSDRLNLVLDYSHSHYKLKSIGHHQKGVRDALAQVGCRTQLLNCAEPNFFPELTKICLREQPIVHAGPKLLNLSFFSSGYLRATPFFDEMNVPVYGQIADHPFTLVMHETLKNASQSTRFLSKSPSLLRELRYVYPHLALTQHQQPFFAANLDGGRPWAERDIDVLFPMALTKPGIATPQELAQEAETIEPGLGEVTRRVWNTLMGRGNNNPFLGFLRHYRAVNGVRPEVNVLASDSAATYANLLQKLDFSARSFKRLHVVKTIAQAGSQLNLRMVLPDRGNNLPEWARQAVTCIGNQPPEELDALMRRAKAAVIVQPSFPGALDERVLQAMSAGTAPLVNAVGKTSGTIIDKNGVVGFENESRVDQIFTDLFWPQVGDIAQNAKMMADEYFTPARYGRALAAIMADRGDLS